jgi:carboxymethylenebutenolidase
VRTTLPSGTAAELALPAENHRPDSGARLGVALATDIMGLRPLFDSMCARLADEHGWVVCAAEPFAGHEGWSYEERTAGVRELDDDRQVGDLVAAADRTGCERTAVMGFCMGGMYALKAAGSGRFDRAVAFYGMIRVPEGWRGAGQRDALEYLSKRSDTPVLALVAGRDPLTPPADVEALRALPDVTVVEYPEAEHGFVHDPARPTHRADDAADAWRRVVEFLS